MSEVMLCPRREFGLGGKPDDDHWQADRTCSYCGGLAPEEFLRRVRRGEPLIPTDKLYKAYVGEGPFQAKFYYQHLSGEQQQEFVELYNTRVMRLGTPGLFYVLPYFVTAVS